MRSRSRPLGYGVATTRPARRTLTIQGAARVAVVADTHSHPHPRAVACLRAEAPTAILHAGDIGDLGVLDTLEAIAPVIAVRGNIDGHGGPPDHVALEIFAGGQALTVLLTHIAVRGPRLRSDARALAVRLDARLVVCGHSHVPLIAQDTGVTVFNPGSVGPRRFGLPITFGVMDFGPTGLSLRHMDCETGQRWRP